MPNRCRFLGQSGKPLYISKCQIHVSMINFYVIFCFYDVFYKIPKTLSLKYLNKVHIISCALYLICTSLQVFEFEERSNF